MLVQMLSAVHSIHNTYYTEYQESLSSESDEKELVVVEKEVVEKMVEKMVEEEKDSKSGGETKEKKIKKIFKEPPPLGADDFLPIFVYVVASSHLPHPQTTFQMIAHLANRDRLEGLAKYFLTVFESALWYLAHLNIEEEDEEEEEEEEKKEKKEKEKKKEEKKEQDQNQEEEEEEEKEKKEEKEEEEEEQLVDLPGDEEESTPAEMVSKVQDVKGDVVGKVEEKEEKEKEKEKEGEVMMNARKSIARRRLLQLERQSIMQEGKLKALDRMMQLNSMSLMSTERRVSNTGSYMTTVHLIDASRGRSVSQEVMEARRASNF